MGGCEMNNIVRLQISDTAAPELFDALTFTLMCPVNYTNSVQGIVDLEQNQNLVSCVHACLLTEREKKEECLLGSM